MSDEAIKRRLRYEKGKAIKELLRDGYILTESNNRIISFSACRPPFFERKIRIVLDTVTVTDLRIMGTYGVLQNQTKEIWCSEKGKTRFRKIEIRDGKQIDLSIQSQ